MLWTNSISGCRRERFRHLRFFRPIMDSSSTTIAASVFSLSPPQRHDLKVLLYVIFRLRRLSRAVQVRWHTVLPGFSQRYDCPFEFASNSFF